MNILGYNRIIVVGNNGSGKSFLSKEFSAITGLPLVHLDVEFWRPDWEKPSKEEWEKRQTELVEKDKWIIDGNHIIMDIHKRYPDKPFFVIKSRRKMNDLLKQWRNYDL